MKKDTDKIYRYTCHENSVCIGLYTICVCVCVCVCVCACWRRECEMSTKYISLVKAMRNIYELEAKTLQEKDHLEELTCMGCYN